MILKKLWFIGVFCLLGCLMGCGHVTTEGGDSIREEDTRKERKQETEDIQDSDLNASKKQRILIDQNGYCPGDEKTVYFLGDEETGIFYVIDADTKEEVYKGAMIDTGYQSESGEAVLKGNFTAVDKEGTYYIEAPYVGRSYTFLVDETHLDKLCRKLTEAGWKQIKEQQTDFLYRVQGLSWMMRYWEYYGEKPSEIVVGETPDFVQELIAVTDLVILAEPQEMTDEEMAFYCASMAQMYEILKPYDVRAASQYLKKAEDTYRLLEGRRYEEGFDQIWLFYDGAILYKATGYTRYSVAVKNYLNTGSGRPFFEEADKEKLLADEAYVHGAIAYLNTTYRVDINLCSVLMDELKAKAESVADERNTSGFLGGAYMQDNRLAVNQLYVVAMIEHVVVSKEYVTILEEGFHYINGCNEEGKSYLTGNGIYDEQRDKNGSETVTTGAYLFVLGEIMESEEAK